MKHITFDEAKHEPSDYSGARYAIDWDNGERKYKEPFRGIRVYESGIIQVSRMGARDPDWRQYVFNNFKLDFRLTSGFGSYTFFDANTGRKVFKKHLQQGLFLYMREWGRVYAGKGWGTVFTFTSEHAQPTSADEVEYHVPNKQRYEERIAQLSECFALGETLLALKGNKGYGRHYMNLFTTQILTGIKEVPIDMTQMNTQDFCLDIAAHITSVEKTVEKFTRDVHTTPYLTVKEK
jgi:hypothetical protein